MSEASSLFERLGVEGISGITLDLYDRVMASPCLEPYFAGVDMQRLVEHQAVFLASIMGGPASYSDEELRLVHAPHAIGAPAFDEMLDLMREVLLDWELSPAEADSVLDALAARRPYIIAGRKRSGPRVA